MARKRKKATDVDPNDPNYLRKVGKGGRYISVHKQVLLWRARRAKWVAEKARLEAELSESVSKVKPDPLSIARKKLF